MPTVCGALLQQADGGADACGDEVGGATDVVLPPVGGFESLAAGVGRPFQPTIALPKGKRASVMSLKCCRPKGRPMTVMEKRHPQKRWVRAMGMPPTIHQMMFMSRARQPEGNPSATICVPNGQRATRASLRVCRPNGMPTMVTIMRRLERAYSRAIMSPPKRIQIMLPRVCMVGGGLRVDLRAE